MMGAEMNSTLNATMASTAVEEPSALKWIRNSLYVLIFLCGTFGNALVILAYRNPRMRSVTNLFIANLAVADLTVALINVPVNITISVIPFHHWPFGLALCKLIPFLSGVSVFSSVGTLIAISVDRYRAIVHPLLPRIRTRHAITIIASIWIVAFVYPVPLLVFTKLVKLDETDLCIEHWPSVEGRRAYTILVFVALYLIPLTAISVLYFLICHNLGKTRRCCPQNGELKLLYTIVFITHVCLQHGRTIQI